MCYLHKRSSISWDIPLPKHRNSKISKFSNLSFQDSSHTCLSFPPPKKKGRWQALRKVTGLPNFSETHFETGAKEYLQFQTPEKKQGGKKSPWISVKGTLNFLNHHQHHQHHQEQVFFLLVPQPISFPLRSLFHGTSIRTSKVGTKDHRFAALGAISSIHQKSLCFGIFVEQKVHFKRCKV